MTSGEGEARRTRLLYIDDDAGLCRLVQRGLERRGYEVAFATSGEEGARAAAGGGFDLIALDHYMPGEDGLWTLRRLKTLPEPPPVVYVTGSDESRIAVAALKEGALDYVVKTASSDFVDLLASALGQAEEQLRLRRERDAAAEALVAANARLEAIVARQAVLMREVNHRVANSLQLVSSLVHLQKSAAPAGPATEALADTQARIEAIIQVHRRLYTSSDVEVVDAGEYLEGLVAELGLSLTSDGRLRFRVEVEPLKVPTDTAVALGVIVAELVTNACKYAYADGASGEVRVRVCADPDGRRRLVVEDDGVGLPADGSVRGTGLGRTVMSAMARTVSGQLTFEAKTPGTRAVLSF